MTTDFLVTTPIPEPGMGLLHASGTVEVAREPLSAADSNKLVPQVITASS